MNISWEHLHNDVTWLQDYLPLKWPKCYQSTSHEEQSVLHGCGPQSNIFRHIKLNHEDLFFASHFSTAWCPLVIQARISTSWTLLTVCSLQLLRLFVWHSIEDEQKFLPAKFRMTKLFYHPHKPCSALTKRISVCLEPNHIIYFPHIIFDPNSFGVYAFTTRVYFHLHNPGQLWPLHRFAKNSFINFAFQIWLFPAKYKMLEQLGGPGSIRGGKWTKFWVRTLLQPDRWVENSGKERWGCDKASVSVSMQVKGEW